MIESLIGLLVLIIIVGICYYIVSLLVDMIPMDPSFKRIAMIILLLVCVLIVLARGLPLLGVSVPL